MNLPVCWLTAVLAAATLVAAPATASDRPCEAGPPLVDGQRAKVIEGDFDGDGKLDRIWVRPPGREGFMKFEMASDPWTGFRRRFDPARRALVVDQYHRCTLIQHARFFDSPIWDAADAPIRLLPPREADTREWRRFTRGGRGDRVLIGTEAGMDILLYWDGRRWRVAHSPDAP